MTNLKIRHVSAPPDTTHFTHCMWMRSVLYHEDRDRCL